jgi:tRNA G18 (ribose-2'-O)-methylase SpoU
MIVPSDPLSAFAGLRDRDYKRAGLIVLEGRIVIEKALSCGVCVRALLCVPADEDEWRRISCGTFTVGALGRAEMENLVLFAFHRGALALADRPLPPEPEALPEGPALVLWNVTDPDNLGALIRSASALGASRVCLGPGCADPYGRKSLRSSMACALGIPVVPLSGADELPLSRGKGGNLLVAAALVPGAVEPAAVAAMAAGRSVTLVVGNEGWGLPRDLVAACDASVVVPMAGGVDSLNVGAAGAILMWELFRRTR